MILCLLFFYNRCGAAEECEKRKEEKKGKERREEKEEGGNRKREGRGCRLLAHYTLASYSYAQCIENYFLLAAIASEASKYGQRFSSPLTAAYRLPVG